MLRKDVYSTNIYIDRYTVDSTYNELAHNEFWVITNNCQKQFPVHSILSVYNKQSSIIMNELTYKLCMYEAKMALFINLKPKLLDKVDKGRKENG